MEIIKISSRNFKEVVKKAAGLIKKGKIIVSPTDTVYGLLADATNKKAAEKVFKIKKRSKDKPIPIFVRVIEMAKEIAFISKRQEKFLRKIWPGKVTAVLTRKKAKIYGIDKKTIGLRVPDYKLVNMLLTKLNRPLTATSANISGKPPSTKINKVINQLQNEKLKPGLILDAGNLGPSSPSTVIDLTKKHPIILREGGKKTKVKKLVSEFF